MADIYLQRESLKSLPQELAERCNISCAFNTGSLSQACNAAFNGVERRPLLIYIQHKNKPESNRLCQDILFSNDVKFYLNENYIIWLLDISEQNSKAILTNIWKKILPYNCFSEEKCPMIIGVIPQTAEGQIIISDSQQKYEILVENNILIHNNQGLGIVNFINKLKSFKLHFIQNEKKISFNFAAQSALPCEIILQVSKYLPITDAVELLSPSILYTLAKYNIRLHLSHRIRSSEKTLYLTGKQFEHIDKDYIKVYHANVTGIFVIFSHQIDKQSIVSRINSFQKLNWIVLHYQCEIEFEYLAKIFAQLDGQIKGFEIYCQNMKCAHRHLRYFLKYVTKTNSTIQHFVFDILRFDYECSQSYQSCFIGSLVDLIKTNLNIQDIHIIIHDSRLLGDMLDVGRWNDLITFCKNLKQINVRVIGQLPHDDIELIKKINNIRGQSLNRNPRVDFEIEAKTS